MLGWPSKTLVAIEAVLDIAFHSGVQPVQSVDITGRQGIPRRSLEPVLQSLTRAGILTGVRGPRGGYRLARERRRLTVGEVVRAISGPEDAIDGVGVNGHDLAGSGHADSHGNGSLLGSRVVRPLWDELGRDVMSRLDNITIEDLCWRAQQAGLKANEQAGPDFSI